MPSRKRRLEHAGRLPQPGVPIGPRNRPASRQSGGTSGDLTVRGHKTKTPVDTKPYSPSEAPTKVQRQIRKETHYLAPLETAIHQAYYEGVKPDYVDLRKAYGREASDLAEKAFIQHVAGKENLGTPEDLTNAIMLATGVGGALKTAGELVAKAGAKKALAEAGTVAAEAGATTAAKSAEKQTLKGILARAASKAEPEAAAVARKKAAQVIEKVPQSVRTGAKVAGKAATYPVRHPIQSPLALQVPAAFVHGDPSELGKAFTGTGNYAEITNKLAGVLGGVPGEAVSLPAAALPSAYLAGKAGLNAAQGDSSELNALLDEWKKTGVLPALASGDLGEAAEHLGEHPLYGALEGSGALSAVGRTAGALAREATGGRVGGLVRPDLPVRGTTVNVKRQYSRDLIRQGAQRAFDKTPAGREIAPDTFRGRHTLKEAQNRFASNEEAVRRDHARQDLKALAKTLPKKKFGRLDRKSADVVNFAVERIIQNPGTFHEDLPLYRDLIEGAAKELRPDGKPALDKAQMASNKALIKQIDAAIKRASPEHVVEAANAFIDLQKPILDELVDLKLLDPEQAAKASATTFARVHMGAGHHEEHGIVDGEGAPLSLDAITSEMQRRGIEPPGFLSHREPTPGDFYRPSFGGAILDKGVRTGESAVKGTQLGGVESLVRQLRRSRGLVDRAKTWNKAVTRFGVEVKGVETMADAKRVLRDPARYGLDPAIQPVAVPRHPFTAKKNEIEGALEHQDPTLADEAASGMLHESLESALSGKLENDTKVIFMPGKVAEQFRDEATPSGPGLKGAQAVTTAFKRAVLPFSPSFYIGNGLDNVLRTTLAGVNPAHFVIGEAVRRKLTKEQKAELLAGAHFSSVDALAPHRSVESLVRGYDPASKTIRAAAEWTRQHGWKQSAVKFAPKLLSQGSHYLLALNSFISEDLPQRGALGKIAAGEMRATQGSWAKALKNANKIGEDFAKGAKDPDKMIRFQTQLQDIYGNYVRMSPAARKVLSTVTPFWTWMRSAYKFVFVTMPVHHPIQTGLIAAAANATQVEREQWGLNKEGDRPVPQYLQGLPLPGGAVLPLANYNSFDYASDPLEAVSKLPFPQVRNIAEALSGRDWKGEEIEGGDGDKIAAALWAFAGAFVPFVNSLTDEEEGNKVFSPHLSLPHVVSKEKVESAREPRQQISVPVGGGSSTPSAGGIDYGKVFGGGGGSGVDYAKVFGGG
jgi:hypothetical protein